MSLPSPSFIQKGKFTPLSVAPTSIHPPSHRFSIIQEDSGFSLSLVPALSDDSGVYFCLVNGQESPKSALRLAVQDVPSTPGKPLIMRFDSSSVELSWSPPLHQHHSPISHYTIHVLEVSTSDSQTDSYYILILFQGEGANWEDHKIIRTKSADSTFTVQGLHPFTVYSFKVTAVNKIGPSTQSQASYHMMTLRYLHNPDSTH